MSHARRHAHFLYPSLSLSLSFSLSHVHSIQYNQKAVPHALLVFACCLTHVIDLHIRASRMCWHRVTQLATWVCLQYSQYRGPREREGERERERKALNQGGASRLGGPNQSAPENRTEQNREGAGQRGRERQREGERELASES